MQLGEQVAGYTTVEAFSEEIGPDPVVVVLGPSCASAPGLMGAEELLRQRPDVGAILVAEELSTDVFQRAIRSGVRDVLAAPVDTAQLGEAVRRVAEHRSVPRPRRRRRSPADDRGGEPRPGHHRVLDQGRRRQVGHRQPTSASSLAQRTDKPVVLVDADLQFGDIAVMLKLAPQHTIVDAVGSLDRLDVGAARRACSSRHEPSGLLVLPGAARAGLRRPDRRRRDGARSSRCCARSARYVVVDTPAYFNDVVLGLIEVSDDVLLVAGMDIPNIKNVKIGLQTLRLLNTPMAKLRLVLNRANSKVKLDVGEVERTLQVKADVARSRATSSCPQSVNKGVPVVLDAPKSGVAKSIEQLADLFVPHGRAAQAPTQPLTAAPPHPSRQPDHERGARSVPLQAPPRGASRPPTAAPASKRRDPVLDELRQKIHHHLIDELGPILYDKRLSEDDLRRRVHEQLHAALAQERAPLSAADKAQLIQDVSDDILGYGPIDRLLKDDDVTEVMVNGPDIGLRRARRQGREDDRHASSTRPTSAASSTRSSARSAGASTSRRRMVRRPPPRRLPRQRGDPPAGHRRPVPHHPEVLQGPATRSTT